MRGAGFLERLKALPKGEARIRVSFRVCLFEGWQDAAAVTLEQVDCEDGVKKTFLFPKFFADLTNDDDQYEVVEQGVKVEYDQHPDKVVGELPEQPTGSKNGVLSKLVSCTVSCNL